MEHHAKTMIGTRPPADIPGDATREQIDAAVTRAHEAAPALRRATAAARATFLRAVARQIEALGDALLDQASAETNLTLTRLQGERARTAGQLRLFADVVEEGSWVEARIDPALPDRKPLPRPDLRRMLIPLGPVAVFGASNFPLAFSVAGGDTASALAAGNPVVVKVHPAHPRTSELTAGAVRKAVAECGLPDGTLSLVYGKSADVSIALVRHPLIKAVGFTGSQKAGRALFDAAAARPEPIPVYAEMGSVNPLFVLPGALRERGAAVAAGFQQSATLGAGQFCTQPGILVLPGEGDTLRADASAFLRTAADAWRQGPAAVMLHGGIQSAYRDGIARLQQSAGVQLLAQGQNDDAAQCGATAALFAVDAATFLEQPGLSEEVFGPASLAVTCDSREQLLDVARNLAGHLTATIHGTDQDLADYRDLVDILQTKVGRLVINGFPTGVEVGHAMNHGGPYPATTDVRTTSVGTAAITRFARPICFQNVPPSLLPEELRDENPRGIWRLLDGKWTQERL